MSIAEMINQGTERQSQSFSVLSENLGRLGQQVGQQLAMREYQKQAAEALPVIQQQMQAALQDAGKGRSADAYSKLLPLLSNPAYTQNQFILPVLNTGLELTGLAAQDSYKRSLMNAQYGGRFAPSQMPSDEEMLSDDFGVTNTTVEGDGMGGAGDVDKYPPNQPVAVWADQADAAAADGLPVMQGATAGQPQEIAALRQPGQLDFSLNKYIPPQKMIEQARQSFNQYSSLSEDKKKDFISSIPEVGKAPEEGDEIEIIGLGAGRIIGPKAAPDPEEMEVTGKEVGITGGKPFKKIKQERKKKPETLIKEEEAEQKKYEGWRENYSKAKLMFERNSQLRSLLEKAGGDITRLDSDIETVTNDANEQVQVANIKIGDQVIGQLETTAPEGMMSEFMAYQTITGAPSLFGKGSKWKFYKTEGEEKPAAAQPAAAGGLPAVQAQAPATAAQAEARTILPEAEGLYKQLSAIEAQEEKISSSEKQNRIKQINKEIESLQKSATQKYSGFGLPGAGKLKTGSKERRDIERDILRVEQLVAERNRLEGKTQTAKSQFNSQEDVIKAIKSGQLTREQGKTILQNQFGLQ